MTLFEYITHSPEALASWILSNKEAVDVSDDLCIGVETNTMLMQRNGPDDGIDQVADAEEVAPEVLEELHAALVVMLNTEVDDDGNQIYG